MIKMSKKMTSFVKEQKRITDLVVSEFKNYYLTGGTALAFYFDHRFSEDLDFFSQKYQKNDPDQIMEYISKKTGFAYQLDAQQDSPKMVPMKVYFMELKDGQVLKIDFVKDFTDNVDALKNGLHSVDDIYLRKLYAAIGMQDKELDTGHIVATGRQSVKDLFDIYYLSIKHKPLSEAFFEYFAYNKTQRLESWYRGFDRTETRLSLVDLVPGLDPSKVFRYLDGQILKEIPKKIA
jgi:predicted nucleotidyltransferase component of viral defense system